MNDWAFFSEDGSLGTIEDGVEFRRARLYLSGTVYKNVDFKAQYDFAGGDADFKDVWLGLKGLPLVGHVRVGHLKEAFGLEELTSSKYITFMERSMASEAFAPSRNVGIRLHNDALDEKLTWSLGIFRDTDGFGDRTEDGNYAFTGRMTFAPLLEEERLVHLGLGYSYRNARSDSVRYRSRPEAHLAPRFLDTGNLDADSENRIGAEVAVVYGPASLQAEYLTALVNTPDGSDPSFGGFYVQGSWFLTGETRAYKASGGTFARVSPKKNLGDGLGALELAVRYSRLDLNDENVTGGEEDNITAGVNWHLNPNVRVMLNYVHAEVEDVAAGDPEGDLDGVMLRFQIDF